jgi:ABC-type antimicrobial peptide transport system permease subunit
VQIFSVLSFQNITFYIVVFLIVGILILGVIDGFVLSVSLISMIRWNSGFEIPTLFPTSIVIQTVMIGILIAIGGAAIPAYRASKISPAEAMRYKG